MILVSFLVYFCTTYMYFPIVFIISHKVSAGCKQRHKWKCDEYFFLRLILWFKDPSLTSSHDVQTCATM